MRVWIEKQFEDPDRLLTRIGMTCISIGFLALALVVTAVFYPHLLPR